MPTIIFTQQEVFYAAVKEAQDTSAKINKLTDLIAEPLVPGESVADRHHKIAKLGRRLALAFTALDEIMTTHAEHLRQALSALDEATPQPQPKPEETN